MKIVKKGVVWIAILILLSGCHSEIRRKVPYKPEVDRNNELYRKLVMILMIRVRHPEWTTEEIFTEMENHKYQIGRD